MHWFIWFMFIFFILLLLLIFSKVRIGVFYKRNGENDRLKIEVGLFNGLIPLRKEIPDIKLRSFQELDLEDTLETGKKTIQKKKRRITKEKVIRYQRKIKRMVYQITHFKRILQRFLAKITVVKLVWVSQIGTGDAAETGVLTGIVWGVKGSIIMGLLHFMKLKQKPQLWVEPSFVKPCLNTEFECIVQFRIGYAMVTGIQLLKHWRKGREHRWQNTQFKA